MLNPECGTLGVCLQAGPETIVPSTSSFGIQAANLRLSELRVELDGAAAVASLYVEARLLSQHPDCRAYIRWNPVFGSGKLIDTADHVWRQLAITEQPVHGNTWAFL